MDYLNSLWQGRMPLFHTYWIVYFLVAVALLYLPQQVLEFDAAEAQGGSGGISAIALLFFPISTAYMVFASVAVWRSAGYYTGPGYWAAAARGAVVFGGLTYVTGLADWF